MSRQLASLTAEAATHTACLRLSASRQWQSHLHGSTTIKGVVNMVHSLLLFFLLVLHMMDLHGKIWTDDGSGVIDVIDLSSLCSIYSIIAI